MTNLTYLLISSLDLLTKAEKVLEPQSNITLTQHSRQSRQQRGSAFTVTTKPALKVLIISGLVMYIYFSLIHF